jgi:chorismate-pyruvate lyase
VGVLFACYVILYTSEELARSVMTKQQEKCSVSGEHHTSSRVDGVVYDAKQMEEYEDEEAEVIDRRLSILVDDPPVVNSRTASHASAHAQRAPLRAH